MQKNLKKKKGALSVSIQKFNPRPKSIYIKSVIADADGQLNGVLLHNLIKYSLEMIGMEHINTENEFEMIYKNNLLI